MSKRIAIVQDGSKYKKKTQTRSGGGYTPRYSGAIVEAGGKKTAHRHIPIRKRDEDRGRRICWCTNYFTEGIITNIIGDYGDVGDYGEESYPDYCNSNDIAIKNYIGIRYEVKLCQGNNKQAYICLSSDFAEYTVNDKVIVFMRGVWEDTNLIEPDRIPGDKCQKPSCKACKGKRRDGQVDDEADGSFLIMPLEIEGINEKK